MLSEGGGVAVSARSTHPQRVRRGSAEAEGDALDSMMASPSVARVPSNDELEGTEKTGTLAVPQREVEGDVFATMLAALSVARARAAALASAESGLRAMACGGDATAAGTARTTKLRHAISSHAPSRSTIRLVVEERPYSISKV